MIIPVKCFTCGNVIGDKYLYFLKKVEERKKDKNIKADNIQYLTHATKIESVEGQVLTEMELTKQCCRRHMLTHVDIFS
jgi:DNA-directed RNA polymerase I, II, and III subunit RPABC5